MSERLKQIREWTTEEMAGVISEEDQTALREAITLDKDAHRIWEETRNHTQRPGIKESWERLDAEVAALQLEEHIFRRQRRLALRRTWRNVSIGVAAAVLLAAGLWFVLRPEQAAVVPSLAKAGTGQPRIELKTSNGKTIDLSNDQEAVQIGDVTLSSKNRMLTYSKEASNAANWSTLTVPAGMDYKLELSDGTIVWLNASSTLFFPFNFTGDTREITINGEAYLQVAKNADKPFIVHLPQSKVHVLGTAFNINTYDSGHIKVSLLEGAVKMDANNQSVSLKPGYEVQLNDGQLKTVPFEADDVLSWRQGIYYFDNAPLSEIAAVIPRWYGVEVVLDSDRAARRRINGVLERDKPLKEFLEQIKMTIDAEYYFKKGVLHFK